MRREGWHWLSLAVLLSAVGAAIAEPGAWFDVSPCAAGMQLVPLAGSHALLMVHDRAGTPGHEALLEYGADGRWRVPYEEWRAWTAREPARLERDAAGEAVVPLLEDPQLAFRYDGCSSEFWVDADPNRLDVRDLNRPRPGPVAPAGRGAFANLDLHYGGLLGASRYSGLIDLGAFVPGASNRNGLFVDNRHLRRLDYDWLLDNPDDARRLRLGDAITQAADWEAPVRFGGLQWGRDFSLQPDRITFPLPSIEGSAALASTAQLYINGVAQGQQPLQPGRFRFDSVPALTGAGELRVVVRDATGREQAIVRPFYASPRLLAPGLDADSYEAGFLRVDYAGPDDRYTQPFAAASLRRGLADTLTASLRASAAGRRQLAGGEADWLLTPLGVLTASAAAAHGEAGWGGTATLGFEHLSDRWSLSLRRRFATRDYAELGREPGSLHFSDTARLGFNPPGLGALSLVYLSEQVWAAPGTRLAGLAFNGQLGQWLQFYASWLHALGGRQDSFVAGLTLPFGRGSMAGTEYADDGSRAGPRAYAQHTPGGPLGLSWLLGGDARDQGLREAHAEWAGARGTIGAGYAAIGSRGAAEALMRSSLALVDGDLFWTRPIQNSFAIVDTAPAAGVHVLRENQDVGVTGGNGKLLVPDLLPLAINRLSIDDRDLPAALDLGAATATLTPPYGAGVPLRFRVAERPSLRLRLLDGRGQPVPVGAELSIDGVPMELPVGYDGLVYADLGPGRHRLLARWADGRCAATLRLAAGVATLGACEADGR